MSAHEIIRSLLHSKLELQDDSLLEVVTFTDSSSVVATLGTKNGAICGPILNYRIGGGETVEIRGYGKTLRYRWENLQLTDNELIVVCNGTTKRFAVTKPPKKESWLP